MENFRKLTKPLRLLIDGATRSCSFDAIASPAIVQKGIEPSRWAKSGARKLCLYSNRRWTGNWPAISSKCVASKMNKNSIIQSISAKKKNKQSDKWEYIHQLFYPSHDSHSQFYNVNGEIISEGPTCTSFSTWLSGWNLALLRFYLWPALGPHIPVVMSHWLTCHVSLCSTTISSQNKRHKSGQNFSDDSVTFRSTWLSHANRKWWRKGIREF